MMGQGSAGHRKQGLKSAIQKDDSIVDISDEQFWELDRRKMVLGREDEGAEHEDHEKHGLEQFPENTDLTITSVTKLKRPKFRYHISFGSYSLDVHEDVMIKYRMIKGAIFNKEELEEIVLSDERQQAYVDALTYLSRKPRTAYEILRRLGEKGWSETVATEIVNRLSAEGIIDDAAYAQEWVGERVVIRGKGKLWVKHELRQKGVSAPLIEDALQTISEEDELESARKLAAKKWRTSTGELHNRRQKTGAFLLRRGFSGSIVSKVIRELE